MTAAAVAEATGGSEPAGAQLGQRTRQQPARFGVADMELSAAHVRRFDQSRGSRHERLPERPCQRAERAQTEAEAATEAAGKAQRQLAQARRRLRQAQERAQAEAQRRAAMGGSVTAATAAAVTAATAAAATAAAPKRSAHAL